MIRHKIVVKRNALGKMNTSIGTDAYNAVSAIPGVIEVKIEAENDNQVEISYSYTLKDTFLGTETHLATFGLERVD
jgi:hypothetical protein